MATPITSRDPRKAAIVAAIKAKSGASRVTMLRKHEDGRYTGHAQVRRPDGGYDSLGLVIVTEDELRHA